MEEEACAVLDISGEVCSPEEASQLRTCILGAQDVFAVEKDELGKVIEVEHQIDTGNSPPVRQPPRCVFALCHQARS